MFLVVAAHGGGAWSQWKQAYNGIVEAGSGRPLIVGSSVLQPAPSLQLHCQDVTSEGSEKWNFKLASSKETQPFEVASSKGSQDDRNPGNNLYVTGLSTRVTEDDLEKFFSKEGKVKHCHVVLDPRTKESRGFAFVTMDTVDDARRCIKYLHRTVLEGRLVTVEKVRY
nr:unnamed protein product [Digitaria exilis]